jgi:hypothetical protein
MACRSGFSSWGARTATLNYLVPLCCWNKLSALTAACRWRFRGDVSKTVKSGPQTISRNVRYSPNSERRHWPQGWLASAGRPARRDTAHHNSRTRCCGGSRLPVVHSQSRRRKQPICQACISRFDPTGVCAAAPAAPLSASSTVLADRDRPANRGVLARRALRAQRGGGSRGAGDQSRPNVTVVREVTLTR